LPGAICSVVYDGRRFGDFKEPTLVRFGQALDFVREIHGPGQLTLVAIDQPTITATLMSTMPQSSPYPFSPEGDRASSG
jgi:predicted RNase H-like nuclease